MQSDVLPYTLYDSMDYSSWDNGISGAQQPQQQAQPQRPAVQSRTDAVTPMPPVPQLSQEQLTRPLNELQGGGVATASATAPVAVKKAPVALNEGDIDIGPEVIRPGGADIGDYKNVKDFLFIFIAVLFIDVLVIFLTRYFPDILGTNLNRWYDMFGLNAVIADVLIIVIGFAIARYVYTGYVKEKFTDGKWSPLYFTGTVVGVQLIHDLLFYFGIIKQIPRGHNAMMDVFKDYSETGGAKILGGDALMMVGSSLVAMFLKNQATHGVALFGMLVSYALPYILYTKKVV